MTGDTEAIIIEGLSKHFGRRVALDSISLTLPAASFVAVMGRNGAGKSTLINTMAGLAMPTSGAIAIMGRPVFGRDTERLRRIGVVPSPLALVELLTCGEQVRFTLQAHGCRESSAESRESELLEVVGLEHERDSVVGELSKGCKKRLALACALANDPDVLLLDEPFADIDPIAGHRLAQDIADAYVRPGRIAVMVTHDPVTVATYCTHLLILEAGHLHVVRRVERAGETAASRIGMIVDLLRSVQEKGVCLGEGQ